MGLVRIGGRRRLEEKVAADSTHMSSPFYLTVAI
jgi:hypothetical protein